MFKLKPAFLVAAFACFLLAFSTPTRAQSNNGTIYLCVNTNNGQLRVANSSKDCKKNEVPVALNLQLLKGDKGDPGPAGPQGPQGIQGPQGERGATGATGAEGSQGEPGHSVTSEVIALGDARCTNGVGGVQYTDSTGVRVVCNGQQGPEGPQGPQGSPGTGASLSFYRRQLPMRSAAANSEASFDISCLSGDVVTGGGFSAHHSLIVAESKPLDADTWRVTIHNPMASNDFGFSVYVICADLTPGP